MPGRCPSCNQTYTDESLTFCPNDGAALVRDMPPSYNQQAGMYGAQPPGNYPPQPPPGNYPPPPPQGYYPGAQPGGQAPPPPGWQQQPPPYGQQQYPPQYGAPAGGKSKMPIIIAVLALVLIGGGIGLYFLLAKDKPTTTTGTTTNTSSSPGTTRSPGSTTTSTFPTTTTSTPSTTTTSGGSYSEDEKHRLFQTVGMTGDRNLIIEVAQKIGIVEANGQKKSNFDAFAAEHKTWALSNREFITQYVDPAKAREYVMAHK
jgi:hypothetical protein